MCEQVDESAEKPAITETMKETFQAIRSLGDESLPLVRLLVELGARDLQHTTHTLLDHLVRTAAILKRWGARDALWKAGLFHSCYGTEFFKEALLTFDEREEVIEAIGPEAEGLARFFCGLDRQSIYRALELGEPFVVDRFKPRGRQQISAEEMRDLIWILWANELEHVPQRSLPEDAKRRIRASIARTARFLPDVARDELEKAYAENARNSLGPSAVARLFNLDDPKKFTDSYWPEKMFVVEGPVERLAGLADYEFDDLVAMKRGGTNALFRTLDGRYSKIRVAEGQAHALYDCGFTIYFHAIRNPKIDEWTHAIERELGLLHGSTRVSAFAARKGAGVINHYDLNDNIVCQARGTKKWRIAPNTHCIKPTISYRTGEPIVGAHKVEAPNGFPTKIPEPNEEIELQPGTVMFMPRGMWHQTETTAEESFHYNIQTGYATWKDAVDFLLHNNLACHTEEFREAIRDAEINGSAPEVFRAQLQAKLRRLVDVIIERNEMLDVPAFEEFCAERRQNIPRI